MRAAIYLSIALQLASCNGFTPLLSKSATGSSALNLAKRKQSMAEKRRQRQSKSSYKTEDFSHLPKSKLDFQSSDGGAANDSPQEMSNPAEAAEKAQDLLKAQRASVDMLTMVRERVEALPSEEVISNLESNGYFVVDDFLGNAGVVLQMEAEAQHIYGADKMEVDMGNLGGGEYTLPLTGGSEQYIECPRLIEWVVSTTKHVPDQFEPFTLDAGACMATLRTFDRNAFQASLALLTGSNEVKTADKPFELVLTDEEDMRRLSLKYYVLPETWDPECGGGMEFESGGSVAAKRDRLVIWKSDSCSFRTTNWKGGDSNTLGSCIELHLVKKN